LIHLTYKIADFEDTAFHALIMEGINALYVWLINFKKKSPIGTQKKNYSNFVSIFLSMKKKKNSKKVGYTQNSCVSDKIKEHCGTLSRSPVGNSVFFDLWFLCANSQSWLVFKIRTDYWNRRIISFLSESRFESLFFYVVITKNALWFWAICFSSEVVCMKLHVWFGVQRLLSVCRSHK
jgi:hypothetical protein